MLNAGDVSSIGTTVSLSRVVHPTSRRRMYLRLLAWLFTLSSAARMLAYCPVVLGIVRYGDSSQHSLFTWFTWLTANATAALWMYEDSGQRSSAMAWINAGNAVMCLITVLVILVYRA